MTIRPSQVSLTGLDRPLRLNKIPLARIDIVFLRQL
jgi:hypothetical protein